MNTDPNEFESLRRLLALKRHEVPPPGYFRDFSARVIARIEANSVTAALPWWERLDLFLRPAAVYAFGVVTCTLLAGALFTAQGHNGKTSSFTAQLGDRRDASGSHNGDSVPVHISEVPASVAPVLPQTSPFNQFMPSAERAKFNVLLVGH
jgi:hypothetical protein